MTGNKIQKFDEPLQTVGCEKIDRDIETYKITVIKQGECINKFIYSI